MKQLAELISVTVPETGQQQQVAAAATAASAAATGTATATALSSNDGPRLKVELRKFSGKEADWDKWHKIYSLQAKILGFAEELVATDEIRVGAESFSSQDNDPLRAKRASEAWLSLITTCKGTVLEIVQSTDSPSAAWRELLQRYRVCGLKEKSGLMREFNSLTMGLGEDPKKFTVRVDPVARDLQRVGKAVDEDDKNLTILNGLAQEYAVERRILEEGDDEPTRVHIEKVILNQYDRLQALAVAATPGHHKSQPAPSKSE